MRNAERTRSKILDAARRILARDGFAGLGVNALASEAGVGKPLVYRYFGDMEGVAAAMVEASQAKDAVGAGTALLSAISAGDSEQAIDALMRYGRGLAGDRARRDLIAWSLAAPDGPASEAEGEAIGANKRMPAPGHAPGAQINPAFGPAFDPTGAVNAADTTDRAAIMAILQAAIAFLLVCRDRRGTWAGMPLREPRHLARLERAAAAIISATFSAPEVVNK